MRICIIIGSFVFWLPLFWPMLCFAESPNTCPSLSSAKTGRVTWPRGPWLPLYINNHELASAKDVLKFQEEITALETVVWNAHYIEMGHCYYQGNHEISLASDMLMPEFTPFSKWILNKTKDEAMCFTYNENDCPFGGRG